MLITGETCRCEMLEKSGERAAINAAFYIYGERARTAEFFANTLMKQCTGKALYRK